eukprot:Em0022g664a
MGNHPPVASDGIKDETEDTVPYTKFSKERPVKDDEKWSPVHKGVMVVSPQPQSALRSTKPIELQKLDKVPKFWPILKSTLNTIEPDEVDLDGIQCADIMAMCMRYKQHLSICATEVDQQQKTITNRLKDLEMFSAGLAQQLIRRQEKFNRTISVLQTVDEVSNTLEHIKNTIDRCSTLAHKLNSLLIPREQQLEDFVICCKADSPDQDDSSVDLKDGDLT